MVKRLLRRMYSTCINRINENIFCCKEQRLVKNSKNCTAGCRYILIKCLHEQEEKENVELLIITSFGIILCIARSEKAATVKLS